MCLDIRAGFMAALQTHYLPLDLYIRTWQIKDCVSCGCTALSDLIYGTARLAASSSALQCHHSTLDVSKEQRMYNIKTPGVGSDSGRRPHCNQPLKPRNRKRSAYACAFSGEVGQLATEWDWDENTQIYGDRRYSSASVTDSGDSFSPLTAEEQKAGWMQLSAALSLPSESSSLTHRRRNRLTLCTWTAFGCKRQSWSDLKLIVKSSSSPLYRAELVSRLKTKQALQVARAPRPPISLRWADTFFNYAHEGRELGA